MFRILFALLFSFFCIVAFAGNKCIAATKMDSLSKIFLINTLDTVVFDLSHTDTTSNQVEIPVYILSDDTVNALDFSLRYNELNFAYDSIIDFTTYMQTFSYYNPLDSTLRFTSNSFQRYDNDSALVAIRFTALNGEFCVDDMKNAKAYLNGDVCSVKILDCLHVAVQETSQNKDGLKIYPNPANESLRVEFSKNVKLELLQMDGRKIFESDLKPSLTLEINTSQLASGVYLVRAFNSQFILTKKISIQH